MKRNVYQIGLYLITFVLLTLFVIHNWFFKQLLIGSGESGLFFYNTNFFVYLSSFTWASPALGNVTLLSIIGHPLYIFISFLQRIYNGIASQEIIYGLLLFFPCLSVIFLKKYPIKFWLIATIFYIFNLVALTLVWNRLQYPFMFFYSVLPIAFIFFYKGLEERKMIYTLIINIILLPFSFAFASFPLLELLWIIFAAYLIFFIIIHWRQKKLIKKAILFFILSLVIWLGFQSYWIIQFFWVILHSSFIGTNAYTSSSDLQTFQDISVRLGNLSYVFRLMHVDFFSSLKSNWGGIYFNPVFTIISYLVPFLTFFPLLLKRKPAILYYFLGLAILLIFFAKGSAQPFGIISFWIFTHIRFLEAFRNPFEKISLALPLAYAPLISYSILIIIKKAQTKIGKVYSVIFAVAIFTVIVIALVFPLWNGEVFMSSETPSNNPNIRDFVKVPNFYKKANEWLNKDISQDRVIALPIDGEGITYAWKYGYSGAEISNGLLDKPIISLSTSIQYLDNIVAQIQKTLFTDTTNFIKIMSILNAKYLMVRSDINFVTRGMTDPEIIKTFIENNYQSLPFLQKTKTFGKLSFFLNTINLPVIYPAINVYFASDVAPYSDVFKLTDFKIGDVIVNETGNKNTTQKIKKLSKYVILTPSKFTLINASDYPHITLLSQAQKTIPHIRYLPGSLGYRFIQLKEYLDFLSKTSPSDKFLFLLTLPGKRFEEFITLSETKDIKRSGDALNRYKRSLEKITLFNLEENDSNLNENLYFFRNTFLSQKFILESEIEKTEDQSQKQILKIAADALKDFIVSNKIDSLYPVKLPPNDNADRVVYMYKITRDTRFDLLLNSEQLSNSLAEFVNLPMLIQIDGSVFQILPSERNGFIYFGTYQMSRGMHEIQFFLPPKNNLYQKSQFQNDVLNLETDSMHSVIKEIKTEKLDPYSNYHVSFDFWIEDGSRASILLLDNSYNKVSNSQWFRDFGPDGYINYYKNLSYDLKLNSNFLDEKIFFLINHFNDCFTSNAASIIGTWECQNDKAFYSSYNKKTVLHVKNIKIERIFTNSLFLRSQNQFFYQLNNPPRLEIFKVNSAKYQVNIKNATDPYFLVFSETYHPLWEATIGKSKISNHLLMNSYANGWYIEKKGNYTITIQFNGENARNIGRLISDIFIVGSLIIIIIYIYKKNG